MTALFIFCISAPVIFLVVDEYRKRKKYKVKSYRKELKSLEKEEKAMLEKSSQISSASRTLIGKHYKKDVFTYDDAKHIFIAGTTGSGKTVALSNYIESAIKNDYPLLLVDGKGDIGDSSMLDITRKINRGRKKLYVINLSKTSESNKYNPLKSADATTIKDMLVNMTEWSEQHYKTNTERFLQRLVKLMELSNLVAVTRGAIETFSEEQLRGVIGHELGHISNGDTKALLINVVGNGIFSIGLIVRGIQGILNKLSTIGIIGDACVRRNNKMY